MLIGSARLIAGAHAFVDFQGGHSMKQAYDKPILTKREALSQITAQEVCIAVSGYYCKT